MGIVPLKCKSYINMIESVSLPFTVFITNTLSYFTFKIIMVCSCWLPFQSQWWALPVVWDPDRPWQPEGARGCMCVAIQFCLVEWLLVLWISFQSVLNPEWPIINLSASCLHLFNLFINSLPSHHPNHLPSSPIVTSPLYNSSDYFTHYNSYSY